MYSELFNRFYHIRKCQLQPEETRGIHPSNRATSQKVWHKHGAPQLGRWLDQWTNMDYFLITGPCTLSSMWSIIRAWRGFCIDFFSGKIVITSAWAAAAVQGWQARPGRVGQGGQGSSRAGTGIDPPKGILIVLKKGCDWTKKCMAVYH